MTFCDIHMHVIPGVDDGSTDMDMSLDMLHASFAQGARAIFATSHSCAYDLDPDLPRQRFQQLQARAAKELEDLKLYLGCEVYCEPGRMDSILQALDAGRYPTMNQTDYVLMEFSKWVDPAQTVPCVAALAEAGWKPVIAHMERYEFLQGRMDLVEKFQSLGALLQVNAYSLRQERDLKIRMWAQMLVKGRIITFLGTDAHRSNHRPPQAEIGLQWLYRHTDRAYADAVAWENARSILMGDA